MRQEERLRWRKAPGIIAYQLQPPIALTCCPSFDSDGLATAETDMAPSRRASSLAGPLALALVVAALLPTHSHAVQVRLARLEPLLRPAALPGRSAEPLVGREHCQRAAAQNWLSASPSGRSAVIPSTLPRCAAGSGYQRHHLHPQQHPGGPVGSDTAWLHQPGGTHPRGELAVSGARAKCKGTGAVAQAAHCPKHNGKALRYGVSVVARQRSTTSQPVLTPHLCC